MVDRPVKYPCKLIHFNDFSPDSPLFMNKDSFVLNLLDKAKPVKPDSKMSSQITCLITHNSRQDNEC